MSKYGYLILRTNGKVDVVKSDEVEFSYDEMLHNISADMIDIVSCGDNLRLIVDDCGLLFHRSFNKHASGLYGRVIVGDAILCTNKRIDVEEYEPDVYKMPLSLCYFLKGKLDGIE